MSLAKVTSSSRRSTATGGPALGGRRRVFLTHVLERFDSPAARSSTFPVRTTDRHARLLGALALKRGSKLVGRGPPGEAAQLGRSVPQDLNAPSRHGEVRVALPGVLVVRVPAPTGDSSSRAPALSARRSRSAPA
jgi:hypothetical protein